MFDLDNIKNGAILGIAYLFIYTLLFGFPKGSLDDVGYAFIILFMIAAYFILTIIFALVAIFMFDIRGPIAYLLLFAPIPIWLVLAFGQGPLSIYAYWLVPPACFVLASVFAE